ncbi:hypothetical protein Golax_007783 [Gossypium laxum]|uniref:Ribosomal eL28/Mak16 domain-containing protein n=1 Tax=Gossypium laxum TaxID=34288 RepID=A0A7J9A7U0_9ROSI|nr:hypothetical protein [Gossypium laxum]
MAAVPGQLIWEVVKKNNCFLVRQFGRGTASLQFSKEPNNLYNLHSYKHSGLANKKTVTIQSGGKDQSVLLATTKTKKQNKPSALLHKSLMKKEFPRMAKAVKNQVTDNYYRPDLTKAALARLSAVHRSLKVAKSGVKKRNRQALKRTVGLDNGDVGSSSSNTKRGSFNRCFSFMEVSMEPAVSSLDELDSNKFKAEIKRWAKAVVRYARQVSGRLGRSSRKSDRYGSSRSSLSHAA